ncbi:MAG: translational GTPase TypA [Planctomycetota bacterium]|jgi:GTP-binding protein
MELRRTDIRNIAIIAHVDHGKTTLVDAMLNQLNVFRENEQVEECVLDSNDIERERGITIFSKNASVTFDGVKINIIDTPGHADFGGEVERVLRMADGVLLLVDAFEGPMPQTRFVLQKALRADLKVVVVVNKIDKPEARCEEVVNEVFDLFCELNANDDQLDFPVIYASGRDGIAMRDLEAPRTDCVELLQDIVNCVPGPIAESEAPLQMQIASLDYSEYVGRLAIGRIYRGCLREKESILLLKKDGTRKECRIEQIEVFSNLGKEKVEYAEAGEIAIITGIPDCDIYDTVASPEAPEAMEVVDIDEPTLTMEFRPNDGPFAGKEGEFVTSRHLHARLMRELLSNVALQVREMDDCFHVSGRGLMHLGFLIENMRREGYELAVGRPHVIFHEKDGVVEEPVELLTVDAPEDLSGKVMELIGLRKGMIEKSETRGDRLHMQFRIPSRGLIGLRSRLLNATRGEAVMHHVFLEYEEFKGEVPGRPNGVLVSADKGTTTTYALDALQLRGTFFIPVGTEVYPGMVVGENNREEDLDVNVTKTKKATNVRAAGSDRGLEVAPHREFSLEAALEYIEDDELLEVTPQNLRIRKRILDKNTRDKNLRAKKKAAQEGS